jgi:hypothetical protein
MTTGHTLAKLSKDYEQYVTDSEFGSLEERIQQGDSGGSFGNLSDSDFTHLLLFNGNLPIFHEMCHRTLFHLPSLLTRLASTQVTHDHYHYWAWTAEVLKQINRDENHLERDIEQMFLLTVDFAVGGLTSVPISNKIQKENKKIEQLVSPHARRAMLSSYRAATQLSYPLLEGLLRRLCSDYVTIDGQIKSGKKIQKIGGTEQKGGRANNLGDLLNHYEKKVAEDETAKALESIRSEMNRYSTSETGYGIINSWRHPHSHGGERFTGPEHAVLLNIACQLVWDTIPVTEYKDIDRKRYSDKIINSNQISSLLNHFDYYPLKETRDLLIGRNREL